ncbi:MAG: cation:proton antiporter [Actinomycetes bacterium]
MTEADFAVLALLVLGWAVVSGVLARRNITGPLVFAAAGYLLGNPDWGPLSVDVETSSVHALAEVTLALVLFSDAARVNIARLRHDLSLPVRLLAVGLPLSVALGGLLAAWLLGDLTWALAGFVGAALAPTDAALSVQVINDERIPTRLRRTLNVESGLNDGIATPIVTFMVAVAASQIGVTSESEPYEAGTALRELGGGVLVGLAIGVLAAALLTAAARRGWVATGGRRFATLAAALAAFALALATGGNGFIAAFVAGISYGAMLGDDVVDIEEAGELTELGGEVLALAVWFLFGATLVPVAFEFFDVPVVVYAVLSLTIVRMLPVAVCLFRSGLDWRSIVFVGWFGPRGLASVVFALVALEELGETSPVVGKSVAVVALTVLLSVVLHGVTAGPGGRRYVQGEQPEAAPDGVPRARPIAFSSTDDDAGTAPVEPSSGHGPTTSE